MNEKKTTLTKHKDVWIFLAKWPLFYKSFVIFTHISTHPNLMRATQLCCLAGEGFRAGRGNCHEWPSTYFDSERLLTATSSTRGLIFDGMKHGTGKQFEEQSRYTKGIQKWHRLRREQRDCPTLNWCRSSGNGCACEWKTQKSSWISPVDW